MTTTFADQPLEDQIAQWRAYLRRRQAVHSPDVEELEGHLRDQLTALTESGLAADEAFLVAVKRMGNLDALSREFARAHSERLWKQLVVAPDVDAPASTSRTELLVVLSLAVAAGLAVKLPTLFGHHLSPDEDVNSFYIRNASLFAFPLLAIYFMWKRGLSAVSGLWLGLPFAAAAVFANVFPFHNRERLDNFPQGSDTQLLTVLHLPIALWLMAIGVAYVGGRWFASGRRMDFVRFSGELFIYYVLIALGGGVVTGFTVMLFSAIDTEAGWFIGGWLIPCGAAGAVIVGSWLVEAKQSVIENMAPVLTRLFTPLFTILLLGFLATMAWTGSPINVEREMLIGFDLLLAVVVGLVLYAASARDPQAPPDFFDGLQLLLVVERARGRCGGAHGDRTAHFRVRIHSQPGGRPWRESHSARQPDVDGVALCLLPAPQRIVCRFGEMADRLPPCVRDMGGTRRCRVSAAVWLPLRKRLSADL